jgi:hypothetical protein
MGQWGVAVTDDDQRFQEMVRRGAALDERRQAQISNQREVIGRLQDRLMRLSAAVQLHIDSSGCEHTAPLIDAVRKDGE